MKPWHHLSMFVVVVSALTIESGASAATVAHWRFEEGSPDSAASGTGSILDWSGNGLHGTPFGGPVYRSVNTVPSSTFALEFDGIDDRISVPDDPLLELTQGLTLEAYIRVDAYPQNPAGLSQIVFRGDDRAGLDPYYVAINTAGHLRFYISASLSDVAAINSPGSLPLGEWLHVGVTLDDSTGQQKMFINGVEVASQVTTIRPFGPLESGWSPGLGIGDTQSASHIQYFPGMIDEVRVSDVALSSSEFLPPIPEPSTISFLALGGLAVIRPRRKSRIGIDLMNG